MTRRKRIFPDAPPDDTKSDSVLCVPNHLVSFTAGLFRELEERRVWASDDDYERGYAFAACCQEQLLSNCIQKLIDEQQRLYRLLDTAINGVEYEVVDYEEGTGRPVIEPELPDVPDQPVPMTLAIRPAAHRIITAIDGGNIATPPQDNILLALRGDIDATAVRNIAELLITIRNKLVEADPDDDSLLEEIRKLLV